jgi:cytochrome bd-type quinol oxidase subunit 2
MKADLVAFVQKSLEKGCSRAQIEEVLSDAGWRRSEISHALSAFAETSFPVAVPRPRTSLTARDAFLYLVLFAALYCLVWQISSLLFLFVDRSFVDKNAAQQAREFQSSLRWHMATLAVNVPVFVMAFFTASRRLALDPAARESGPRKWLTYISLFVAVMVISGVLVGLLYWFLSGDLSTRFILKSLIVLGLTGGVGAYLYADIRGSEQE